MNVKNFENLKQTVSALQRDVDKAQGAYDQLMEQLTREFGCQTIKAARELLKSMEGEEAREEARFNEELAAFRADLAKIKVERDNAE